MRNIVVPELGESVVEARVARWLKKEGDSVRVGEPVVELETEKIDLEVNADSGGVIASIKRQEGEDVKIGELLAVVDDTATAPSSGNGSATAASSAAAPPEPAPAPEQRATPTAKRIARDHDVDLGAVAGSGSSGRVMKQDVEGAIGARGAIGAIGAIGAKGAISAGARSERRERMSKRRETIARRLVEAQHNAAMLTTFNEVDMTAIMQLRERRKEAFKKEFGVGLGIASFFV